jgi:hypothetical protein
MTCCFSVYLVPRARTFRPELERLASLVARLRAERWVLTPEDPDFDAQWARPPQPTDHFATGGWAEPFYVGPGAMRARSSRAVALPIPVDAAWIAARLDARGPLSNELSLRLSVNMGTSDFDSAEMPYPFDRGSDQSNYHDFVLWWSQHYVAPRPWIECSARCACGEELAYAVDAHATSAPISAEHRVRPSCPRCGAALDPDRPDLRPLALHRFAVVIDCQEGWPREDESQEMALKADALRRATGLDVVDIHGNAVPRPEPRARKDAGRPVVRSPYGDAAPNVTERFLALVEETAGCEVEVFPEFT